MKKPVTYYMPSNAVMDVARVYRKLLYLEIVYAGRLQSVSTGTEIVMCTYSFSTPQATNKFARFLVSTFSPPSRTPEIIRPSLYHIKLIFHHLGPTTRQIMHQAYKYVPRGEDFGARFLSNLESEVGAMKKAQYVEQLSRGVPV